MMKKYFLSTVMILTLLILGSFSGSLSEFVNAEKVEISGKEVMEKVYNRDQSDNRESNLKMILINKHGSERVRELKQLSASFAGVDKKIMFFISPQDVRGTSFMNWSYQDGRNDIQWIYLPSLRKVRRISSESKSDNFMGSDFTYDDMGDRKLEDDNHSLLKTEKIDGELCYVVENIPVEEDSIYSRTITWVLKNKWIELKKEFYDQEGKLLKELKVEEYQEIDGILTVTKSEIENFQSEHKTQLIVSEVEYNSNIAESEFTEKNMRTGL